MEAGNSNWTVEELRSNERKYRSLIEGNGVGYVILDADGTVIDANQHYVTFTGHVELKEILGRNVCDWIAPQDKEEWRRAIGRCLSDGTIKDLETRYFGTEGRSTALLVNATVEWLDGVARILVLGHDITVHKREEDLWLREKQFTEAVFESAPFLLFEYDDQLRLTRWNKRAEAITGYASADLNEKSLFDWFGDAELPRIRRAMQNVRLYGHGTVEAHLTMKDGAQVPHHYTAVRLIIGRREVFICIGVDLTALKQVEKALRESELRLQTLIEQAAVPISIAREGMLIYANAKYLSLFGYEKAEEIIGHLTLDRFAPQAREQIGEFIWRKEQGHPAPGEYESIGQRADGTQFPVLVAVTNVRLADGPVNFICLTDISARKAAEETIRAERDRAELYLRVAEVMLVAIDCDGIVTLINRKGCQILGYEEAELLGKNWFKQCLPQDQYEPMLGVFRTIVTGGVGTYEYNESPVQTRDGGRRLIAWHNSTLRDECGCVIGTMSSGEDITDRRRSEEALLIRGQAIASAINGVAIADIDGKVTYANDSFLRLWGYESDREVIGKPAAGFWDSEERAFEVQRLTLQRGSHVGEGRARRKDGSLFTAQVAATVIKDETGKPICLMSSFLNITDRKRAEEELKEANEKLSSERETLRQKNIALQELLAQVNENRRIIGTHIQSNIEMIVMPVLDRLPTSLDSEGKQLLSLARESLTEIVSPFVSALVSRNRKLTQREVELCDLIRRGLGSKEIAKLRGCSVQTVIKQRKVIRKKLGITGMNVNLAAFLTGLPLAATPQTPEVESNRPYDSEL